MFQRLLRFLILFISQSALVIIQLSLVSALPDPFRQVNLVLISLLFILFFIDWRWSLMAALVSGFWLDVLSFNFFGFYLLTFLITLYLADLILRNLLTNRSLYSLLALVVASTVFYNLLTASIIYLFGEDYGRFFLFQSGFWRALLFQSLWSFSLSLISFNLAVLVSKRIKPFFLEKKSWSWYDN